MEFDFHFDRKEDGSTAYMFGTAGPQKK